MLQAFTRQDLEFRGRTVSCSSPLVMGILNATPDSFSDGGRFNSLDRARQHCCEMLEAGASIIDVGGESTRPGAPVIAVPEEIDRILPVVEFLLNETDAIVSIDTSKSEVARAALEAGAHIVNDVTGARDPGILSVVAEFKASIVLMHMRGTPMNMTSLTDYDNVLVEVLSFLQERIKAAREAGITSIVADPGIGFAKNQNQNLILLNKLSMFHELNVPVLLGPSRKSFIGNITGQKVASERIEGTIVAAVVAALQGVQIVRVHDVAAVARALKVTEAIQNV